MPIQKITSGIIQDGAIVAADIVSIANTQITGNIVSSQITSVANTQITGNITATTSTNLAGGSNGTIPYQSASGTTQMLAVGTSGQLLQTNGAGAPSWVTASAGALTLLSTVTASASATVDMETTFSSTYNAYLIIGSGIVISNDGGSFSCRLKIGGSYSATDYKGHFMQAASGSTTYSATANATDAIGIAASVGSNTNEGLNFTMRVYLPSGTTLRNMVTGEVVYTRDSADVLQGGAFLGGNTVVGAVTGVRFLSSGGTITSGVFRLYGFANS